MKQKGNSLKDWQRAEALLRMRELKLRKDIIQNFSDNGAVMVCENPSGNFTAPDEELSERIRYFRKKYRGLVYLILRVNTAQGLLDSFLYVSKCPEEWKAEMYDLEEGIPFAYTINHVNSDRSGFSSICIATTDNGGVIRAG